MALEDFKNGLQNASDYINTGTINVPTSATINDQGTVSVATQSIGLKELICGLLAGNGIKLPNLQICLKVNLARMIGQPGLPDDIRNALSEAESALDDFIAHTNIDNALNRLNSVIGEVAAIANMINFCGTPVTPRPIPNVLKDAMGSYLGAGKDILNTLGTMADSDIGGCISTDGGFNADLFTGGLLKQLGSQLNNLGNLDAAVKQNIMSQLDAFKNDIKNLIEFENNFASTSGNGGSTFAPANSRVNTGVGVAIDTANMSMSDAQRIAGNLQSVYDSLSNYEVDDQGNNIFSYLLEPEMIARLEAENDPTVALGNREPVMDHCGRIIGYTERSTQQPTQSVSLGGPVEAVNQPASAGLQESGAVVFAPPSTTTNLANTSSTIDLQELKQIVADSTDFADFKNRIQNL